MERIFALFLTLALSAGLSGQADAAAARKKRPHAGAYTQSAGNPLAANGYTGYYERVLDRVPYGSQLWWRVYDSMPKGR